jgi:coenzyme PQQ precursor peptide PqqA
MWNELSATNSWTQPSASELRFGFEVTLYVMNR